MKKWFCDLHHASLAYSIRLLARRLNAKVYYPIGLEWFDNGYWQIAKPYGDNPATISQYLSLDQRYKPIDGTLPLNTIKSKLPTHYEVLDLFNYDTLKSITLDQFKEMDIDVVIASIPDHVESFTRLIKEYKPKAKLVFQVGNIMWDDPIKKMIDEGLVKNLLASVMPFDVPPSVNAVFYHQEIPLREYKEPPFTPKIKSFVHLLPNPNLYFQYKSALPEVEFKAYGAQCPDGYCNGISEVYDKMQDSSFIFHNKAGADGFGHVIHSAFMLGRPPIVNYEEYKNKLAGSLMIPDETCISLDSGDGYGKIVEKIRNILKNRKHHLEMCRNSYESFRSMVHYEYEQEKIKQFFDRLQ